MSHQRSFRPAMLLWVVVITTLLALAMPLPSSMAHRVYADGQGYRPGQIVVKVNPANGMTINAVNAKYGTTTLETLAYDDDTFLLQLPPGADAQIAADALDTDPGMSFAEPNFTAQAPEAVGKAIHSFSGFDPGPFSTQSAAALLGLARAHTISTGKNTIVAVIDTGMQLNHPAFNDVVKLPGYDFVDKDQFPTDEANGLDDDGNGLIDEAAGHGTHVAGIIHLVAPDAEIMPLRVLDSDGNGDLCDVAAAINYAVDHGADVINLSLGTPAPSDLLKDVIRNATRRGVVVVAATGNLHNDIQQYPAATPCVISVTSVGPAGLLSDFANYGSWVDFAAPGEDIYSSLPVDGYGTWSGTSMAAPFVAGQAALIHSRAPWMNVRRMSSLMGATADQLDTLNPAFAGRIGFGQVDIGTSLSAMAYSNNNLPTANRGIISSSCVAAY